MIDILAVGELLIDFTPMKTQNGMSFVQHPGGAPCNMLAMAQALGCQTSFIGKVGKDQFGLMLKETLTSQGIQTKGLVLSSDYPTTLAFVHLTDDGERSFSFYREGCADVMLTEEDVDVSLIDETKVLHFGSLSFTNEPAASTTLRILKRAKSKNKVITYDPNYRPALWLDEKLAIDKMKSGLKYADILKVSDEEAFLLTGETTVEKAAAALFEYGLMLVTVTLGEAGVYYHHEQGCGRVQGFLSQVVDTTGAGDAFFGGFISKWLTSNFTFESLENALKVGNAAASLVVENYGGISSIPSKEKVMKRLMMK